jgi:hypothetical protein
MIFQPGEGIVKTVIAVAATSLLFALLGCSGNDRTGAGLNQGAPAETSAATQQDYSQKPPATSDPEASGGTTLKASTPYNQTQGSTVSQNLNAAPFLNQQPEPMAANRETTTAQLPANRAMGTVDGPMDQPPAGIAPDVNQNSRSLAPSPSGRSSSGAKVPAPSTPQAPRQ